MGELFSTEDHPREQQDAQVTLQHVVERVAEEVGGQGDVEAAGERLEAGVAASGPRGHVEPAARSRQAL